MKTCQNLLFQMQLLMQWQVIHKLVENSRVSEVKETTRETCVSEAYQLLQKTTVQEAKNLKKLELHI